MKLKSGVLVTALFVLLAPSASAGEDNVGHRVPAAESASAVDFWTPSRLDRALRRDPVFGTRAASPAASATGPALRHRPVTVYRPEVGKIVARDRYGPFTCSGAVINTRSLRLVLTAAHCLYFRGSWARKLLFFPNFKKGRRPFGAFRAKNLWVPGNWYRNSFSLVASNFDLGLIVTRKRWNGSRIGEVTGAIDVQTYPNRRGVTDIYGYPAARMRGRVMRTCRARTKRNFLYRALPGPVGMLARCNMAGGSSGGPWVSRYRRKNGGTIGVVDGLTSTGFYRGGRSYLASPYFGYRLVSLIRSTEGR